MTVVADPQSLEDAVTQAARPEAKLLPTGWPEPLTKPAFHGLAGQIVRAIEPHTEADPASILLQFLAAIGNVVGRIPHFKVEATRHYQNLFVALVGDTAKARKGTSWGHIHRLFALAEAKRGVHGTPVWGDRIITGLSSGEGLIWAVRDPSSGEAIDPGVIDKRRVVLDGEFAQTLKAMSRQGNTLSPVIRNAWDSGELRITTKNSPTQATGAHISFIGHITRDELKRELNSTEVANGFANRFLWVCVTRSKFLPDGGDLRDEEIQTLADCVATVTEGSLSMGEIKRDDAARELWYEIYRDLSDAKTGMLGSVTARAEAQVVRLACLYAILDLSSVITVEHLKAALAVWDYCLRSAGFLWGDATGDPVADALLEALRRAGSVGMSRTQIRDFFQRNQTKDRINAALKVLEDRHLAKQSIFKNGNDQTEMWHAT